MTPMFHSRDEFFGWLLLLLVGIFAMYAYLQWGVA